MNFANTLFVFLLATFAAEIFEMNIQENISLKKLNTLGIDVQAKLFCEVNSVVALQELLRSDISKNNKKLILGGGSNILFTKDFDGLVIKNNIKEIKIISEDDEFVFVK